MSNTQDAVERAMELAEDYAVTEILLDVPKVRAALRAHLELMVSAGEPAQLLTKAKITALIAVAQAASAVAQTSGISIDDMANLSGALAALEGME